MWHRDIASRMTEDRALELCHPTDEEIQAHRAQGLQWSDDDTEHSARELRRSVRYIADAAELMSREHLLLNLDALPRLAKVGGAPKMDKLLNAIVDAGYAAARYPDLEPMLVTDAPFESVIDVVRACHISAD